MRWSLDARIPLSTMAPADLPALLRDAVAFERRTALLIPQTLEVLDTAGLPSARFEPGGPGHAAACACCGGRPPVSAALDQLFQARIRGTCIWFDQVIALVPDEASRAEVETALMNDPLTSARFRPG